MKNFVEVRRMPRDIWWRGSKPPAALNKISETKMPSKGGPISFSFCSRRLWGKFRGISKYFKQAASKSSKTGEKCHRKYYKMKRNPVSLLSKAILWEILAKFSHQYKKIAVKVAQKMQSATEKHRILLKRTESRDQRLKWHWRLRKGHRSP